MQRGMRWAPAKHSAFATCPVTPYAPSAHLQHRLDEHADRQPHALLRPRVAARLGPRQLGKVCGAGRQAAGAPGRAHIALSPPLTEVHAAQPGRHLAARMLHRQRHACMAAPPVATGTSSSRSVCTHSSGGRCSRSLDTRARLQGGGRGRRGGGAATSTGRPACILFGNFSCGHAVRFAQAVTVEAAALVARSREP